MIGDNDAAFRSAERAWLEPPDDPEPCREHDEIDCEDCEYANEPDPDRERDERIDREMEDRYGPES